MTSDGAGRRGPVDHPHELHPPEGADLQPVEATAVFERNIRYGLGSNESVTRDMSDTRPGRFCACDYRLGRVTLLRSFVAVV
jgi:hypothetical protein